MSFLKRYKWPVLGVAALLVAVALYAVAGFWLVPKIGRSQATAYVEQTLHKRLDLGEIRFNPFTFELDVSDIAIRDPDARASARPLLGVGRLYVDFQGSSLLKRGYDFREVTLERPYARAIIRSDGSLNLTDLIPPSEEPQAPLPEVRVGQLNVRDGRVDFADWSRRLKPEKTLAPINFGLADLSTVAESGGFQLAAASEQGERFEWSGTVNLQPVASRGQFKVQGLRADSVQAFLGEELPATLTAGSFDFAGNYDFGAGGDGPLRLDASLPQAVASGLSLRAHGADEDWVVLPKATLENTRLSLAGQSIEADALRLDGVQAKVWMDADGNINLLQMFAPETAPVAPAATQASVAEAGTDTAAAPATADPAATDWSFVLHHLGLQQAQVDLEDRTVRPSGKFALSPMDLQLDEVSLDLTRPVPMKLSATVNGKAQLALDGTIVPETVAADLQLDVSGLSLGDVTGYLPALPGLTLKSGTVAAKGRVQMRPEAEPGPALSFDGDGSVSGFDLVETEGMREFVSWDRVDAQGIAYSEAPDAVSIREVRLHRPFARVIVTEDQHINLVDIFSAQEAGVAPASTSDEMPIKVGKLRLDNATMSFADFSMDPSFQARIDALNGSISGLSTATNSVADIDLNGHVVNQYSPVTIQGGTNLFAFDKHTDIKMAFSNIDLPIFNPYSGRFAGYAIAKGKLSTELHYQISDRKLDASHHVVLDQLEWGEATDSKDKVSLPIRLATSLLKNREGVIDLDLPVTGSLDDPKFRVWPVVWQILKNLLTKIVTAPFAFLGSLFEGAEDAQFVDFTAGSAELGEAGRSQLAALAKGLVDRPALKLEIPAGVLAEVDAAAIAQQRLQQALAGEGGADPLQGLPADEQVDRLAKLYRQEFEHKPDYPETEQAQDPAQEELSRKERHALRDQARAEWLQQQLLDHYRPPAEEVQQLARARADAIQDALLAGGELDPARVFVTLNKTPVEHEGKVRIELGLE
ncbi:DUF748 domain-containing protein [Pseudoxanthomonas kalamensis]|uniref:DUF748 domain-containing protein n=1 Tax=Pseudoxanthomonas kalamensis TaxID=289483 RepID=UPI001391516A|nr:DUF748 domain-containing protein [Pseudoxanthomonas kalamensis]